MATKNSKRSRVALIAVDGSAASMVSELAIALKSDASGAHHTLGFRWDILILQMVLCEFIIDVFAVIF